MISAVSVWIQKQGHATESKKKIIESLNGRRNMRIFSSSLSLNPQQHRGEEDDRERDRYKILADVVYESTACS